MMNAIYKFLYWFRGVVMGNPIYIYKFYILGLQEYQLRLTRHFLALQLVLVSARSSHSHKPNQTTASVLAHVEGVLKRIDGHNRCIRLALSESREMIALFEGIQYSIHLTDREAVVQEIDRCYAASK